MQVALTVPPSAVYVKESKSILILAFFLATGLATVATMLKKTYGTRS